MNERTSIYSAYYQLKGLPSVHLSAVGWPVRVVLLLVLFAAVSVACWHRAWLMVVFAFGLLGSSFMVFSRREESDEAVVESGDDDFQRYQLVVESACDVFFRSIEVVAGLI